MNTYDETIYQAQMDQDGNENETQYQEKVEEPNEQKATMPKKSSNGWAKVTAGGITGVLMGAAGMYVGKPYVDDAVYEGRNALADWMEANGMEELAENVRPEGRQTSPTEPEATPEPISEPNDPAEPVHIANGNPSVTVPPISGPLQVAHVDQSLSFANAFAEARAEVGPGGVFHWHGGVFNTYTEAEWDSMSAADKSDFAHHAAPVVRETLTTPTGTDEPDLAIIDDDNEIIDVATIDEEEITISGSDQPLPDEELAQISVDEPYYVDDPSADLDTTTGMDDMVVDDPVII